VRTREHLLHHKSVNIDHAVLQEVQRQHAQLMILGPIAGQFTTPGKEDKIIAIPLNKLTRSARNVRKSGGDSIDDLATILVHGLIHNLTVVE
jgi:hypothetical protein